MPTAPTLRPYTDSGINAVIAGRWSSRAIDPQRDVPPQMLATLLEAARWAPSSRNHQPWTFAVATRANPSFLDRARGALVGGNGWARKAPVLIFPLSRKRLGTSWLPNRLHRFETGMATAQMALQAAELGLVFHQMLGFNPWAIRRLFHVPRSHAVLSAIAVGFPGDGDDLSDRHREAETAPRTRRAVADISVIDQVFRR